MLGRLIDGTFDLIGALWNGFWNVFGKLFGLVVFTIACGAAAAAVIKIVDAGTKDAWLYFKGGACIGFLLAGIRLVINEVAVPLVHAQERRLREDRRRQLDIDLAHARALSGRESVSNRMKHLH